MTSFPFQSLLAPLQRKEASDVHFKHKHVQLKQHAGQLYLRLKCMMGAPES